MTVLIHFTPEEFLRLGLELVGFKPTRVAAMKEDPKLERFCGSFGIWPEVCSKIFDDFQTTDIDKATIHGPSYKYFLITLNWMKTYKTESEMAGIFDLDEKTLRTQIRKYLYAIHAFLPSKIIWRDLKAVPEILHMTVDGVHCRVFEQHMRPDRNWKSFKLNVPGLAYELGILVSADKLVWINGPFKGGTRDIDIFNKADGLGSKIPAGKKVLADSGYPGVTDKVSMKKCHMDSDEVYEFKNRALAHHETFNGRIKRFNILTDRFGHRGKKKGNLEDFYKVVFETVCMLVQYELENGHPLFAL